MALLLECLQWLSHGSRSIRQSMGDWYQVRFLSCAYLLSLAFISVNCAGLQKEPDPKVYYKRDLRLQVGDRVSRGTLTLPASSQYKIELKSPGKMDLLTISSCHREYQKEEVGYEHTWTYAPVAGLEDQAACPLQINGYDKNKGKHAFGYISFERLQNPLKAKIQCNGESFEANGVGICQSRQGLQQKISFESEVRVIARDACNWHLPPGKEFVFSLQNRECQYLFKETQGQKEFVLDTIGYEEILLRQD